MGFRHKTGQVADGAVMAVPRVVGAHGNVIKKLIYDIPGNFLTRTKEKFKKTVAAVSNIYSNPHFPYEGYEKVNANLGFWNGEKWKARFGNAWKGIKNFGKSIANGVNNVAIRGSKTVALTAGLAIATVFTNPLKAWKDLATTNMGFVHDVANAGINITDVGPDKKDYAFSQVPDATKMSYADYKAKDLAEKLKEADDADDREIAGLDAKKAKIEARKAARKGTPPPEKKVDPAPKNPDSASDKDEAAKKK